MVSELVDTNRGRDLEVLEDSPVKVSMTENAAVAKRENSILKIIRKGIENKSQY